MAAHRRSSSRVSRGTRRKFVWAHIRDTSTVPASGVPNRLNLLGDFETALGAQLIGATVVRIRGVMSVVGTAVVGGVPNIVRAAAIVEPNPGSAAVAADGPWGGQFNDWMLFEPFMDWGPAVVQTMPVGSRVIDVKSSRKIEEINETLFLYVAAPVAPANSAAVQFTYDLSIGIKLP